MTNTKSGANAGTLMYQHKESLTGKRAEAYMDVYALGCIILELYTGRRVWSDIVTPHGFNGEDIRKRVSADN